PRFQSWSLIGSLALAVAGGTAFLVDPPQDGLRTDLGKLHLSHLAATVMMFGSVSMGVSALFSDRRRVMAQARDAAFQAVAAHENEKNLRRMGIDPRSRFGQIKEVQTLCDPHLPQGSAAELARQLILENKFQPKQDVESLVSSIAERSQYI